MHECDWLDALVKSADHWATELHEDPDSKDDLYHLCKTIKAIHHLGGIVEIKLMDKYRERQSIKL